ncbi:Transmembrane protease serine 5 [Dipsacomyces acuminosporus]|nr:Transmembrane protease serine 5 [Dipsacomyces acuminosporus]
MNLLRCLGLCMFVLVLASSTAASAVSHPATTHRLTKRVVGGKEASPTDYPFAVYIHSPDVTNSTSCAGAILTDQIIVTSAYCVYDRAKKQAVSAGSIRIGFGNSDIRSQARAPVEKIIVDSTYDHLTGVDNIALLQVNLTKYISDKVNRIPVYIGTLQSGDSLAVMGWGSTDAYKSATNNQLVSGKVVVGDHDICKQGSSPYTNTNGRAVCTLNKMTPDVAPCLGDYGGPLVAYDNGIPKLVGLFASFVTKTGGVDYCTNKDYRALYTHVSEYLPFITKKTGLSDDSFTGNALLVATTPEQTTAATSKKLSTGAIAGIAVGAVVAAIAIAILSFFLYRNIRRQKQNRHSEYIYELGLQQLAEELGGSYEPKQSTTISVFNSSTVTPFDDGPAGRPSFTSRYLRNSVYDDSPSSPFSDHIPQLSDVGTELSMDTLSKSHCYADGSPMVMEFIRPNRDGRISDSYPYLLDHTFEYSDDQNSLIIF